MITNIVFEKRFWCISLIQQKWRNASIDLTLYYKQEQTGTVIVKNIPGYWRLITLENSTIQRFHWNLIKLSQKETNQQHAGKSDADLAFQSTAGSKGISSPICSNSTRRSH